MNEQEIRRLVSNVVTRLLLQEEPANTVPVEVSARHVHLTQEDVEALFGPGHTLTHKRNLSQPGQFLAEERVSVVTAKNSFHNVAVLGPARSHTQVELSMTDARTLGLKAPIRQSGDTAGCPDVCLMAGSRMICAKESVMVAQNHIHMTPADASRYGVADGQKLQVEIETERPVTFDGVVIRVREDYALAMHIDLDEANACAFQTGESGRLVRQEGAK
ncbi:MAG: phosphate propanoyltransferase [Oscillibacter sp.]|jgi:putative phosphotransacetylase|nr:phosphate propanoyltransferase [Oscillibacter sp.]